MIIMQTKQNRNAIRSKNMLINAFVEIVQDTPVEKVTVTNIVNKAGLNRSTFYAHFQRPEDIVKYIQRDIIENLYSFLDEVEFESLLMNPMPLMERVADFVMEREGFYGMLIRLSGANGFLEELKEAVIEKMLEDEQSLNSVSDRSMFIINLRFMTGGYVSLYRDWFNGRTDKNPYEFSKIIAKTIIDGVRACM